MTTMSDGKPGSYWQMAQEDALDVLIAKTEIGTNTTPPISQDDLAQILGRLPNSGKFVPPHYGTSNASCLIKSLENEELIARLPRVANKPYRYKVMIKIDRGTHEACNRRIAAAEALFQREKELSADPDARHTFAIPGLGFCKYCSQPVFWATSQFGNKRCLDAQQCIPLSVGEHERILMPHSLVGGRETESFFLTGRNVYIATDHSAICPARSAEPVEE